MQLAILCGGLGSRLGKLGEKTPKSLQDINGTPFLDILLKEYRKAGFDDFVLLTGYLGQHFRKYRSNSIKVIKESRKMGTGGAVINALRDMKRHFWVANGDTFIEEKCLRNYIWYSRGKSSSLIFGNPAGLFSYRKEDLMKFKKENLDLGRDINTNISNFHYCVRDGKYLDIGTPENLDKFREAMKK